MNKPRNPIDALEVIGRYMNGESQMSVAARYKVDRETIKRILTSNGVAVRGQRESVRLINPGTLFEKYEQRVDRSAGSEGCHPWTGYRNAAGYGIFQADGHRVRAHRWGYTNLVGPIPEEKPHIMHLCDNPPCQNPRHWRPGTHQDNVADMMSKSRNAKGERYPFAKLTVGKVRDIRAYYRENDLTQQALADRFGISLTEAHNIVRNKLWRHIDSAA